MCYKYNTNIYIFLNYYCIIVFTLHWVSSEEVCCCKHFPWFNDHMMWPLERWSKGNYCEQWKQIWFTRKTCCHVSVGNNCACITQRCTAQWLPPLGITVCKLSSYCFPERQVVLKSVISLKPNNALSLMMAFSLGLN